MWLLPRLRLALARRPWLYWSVVALCALLAWAQLSAAEADAVRARRAWGEARTVWVAVHDAEPGEPLGVARRDYPAAMVPGAAIGTEPLAPVAARQVRAGAVLLADDVAGEHAVPAGWVVLALPADGAPSLVAGRAVAVFAGGRRTCDGTAVDIAETQVDVAVPPECGSVLSAHIPLGDLVLARLP